MHSVDERLPEKNQLVLAWLSGVKGHSDVLWKREGWYLVPWHGTVWAWQYIDAACKHLDADSLEVTHWMPLPTPPTGNP